MTLGPTCLYYYHLSKAGTIIDASTRCDLSPIQLKQPQYIVFVPYSIVLVITLPREILQHEHYDNAVDAVIILHSSTSHGQIQLADWQKSIAKILPI